MFYFLLIRPQQQKQKELRKCWRREARRPRGDRRRHHRHGAEGAEEKDGKVPHEIEVEIAPNLRVTVLRETIANVVNPVPANDPKPVKDTKAS